MQSYKDLVGARTKCRPEYEWLNTFIEQSGSYSSETRVTVFDSKGKTLEDRGQFSSDTEQFSRLLSSQPPELRTRFIVVAYQQTWAVDRAIINRLGTTYEIDPDFFRRHFYYDDIYSEDNDGPERWLRDSIHDDLGSPSEDMNTTACHVAFTQEHDKMSAYLHQETQDGPQTVLIFIRHRLGETSSMAVGNFPETCSLVQEAAVSAAAHLTSLYLTALREMSQEDIEICNQDPHYVLCPYIRMLLQIYRARFWSDYSQERLNVLDHGPLARRNSASCHTDKLCQIQREVASLCTMHREVLKICHLPNTSQALSEYISIQNDISSLSISYEKAAAQFTESTGALIDEQLKEAEASKNAAVTANRLSKLACAVIPLSIAIPPVSVKDIEVGQVTPHLWTLFVTVLAIGLCSLIPFMAPFYYRTSTGAGSSENTQIIVKLMRQSPMGAFWYISLCLRFDYAVVMALCGERLKMALKITRQVYYEQLTRPQAEKRMRRSSHSAESATYWLAKANCVADRAEQILDTDIKGPLEC